MIRKASMALGLTVVMGAVFLTAPAFAAEGDEVAEALITVIIGNAPMQGWPVLPATDTDFRLKLRDTGDVVSLKWSQLDDSQRKRLQKIYGLQLNDQDHPVFGEKIRGIRLHLDNGKYLEGVLAENQNLPGRKILRTLAAGNVPIQMSSIKREEVWECYESDVYSPKEIYEKWKFEKPPAHDDAAAHLDFARKASSIRLYKEALDHLRAAELIDPRTVERNADFRQEVINLHQKQQSEALFDKLMSATRTKDYFEAKNLVDQLDRNFPYSDLKSRWDSMRAEIDAGGKAKLREEVVRRAYALYEEVIRERMMKKVKVDEKGNEVPSIPGKQVTTRKGQIFTGTLQKLEGKDIFLFDPNTNLTIRIAGNQVMSETDIDLAKGYKEVEPTFDQLKEFVTDTGRPDGAKMLIVQRIAQFVKQPEKDVLALFDGRLDRNAEVSEDGTYSKEKSYAEVRDIHMGRGSWLRDGSKPEPITPVYNNRPQQGGRRPNQGRNQPQQPQQPQQAQQPREEDDPDLTDDPQTWWKYQNFDTRLNVLKGLGAEKVFKLNKCWDDPCRACTTTGKIPSVNAAGEQIQQRCPNCRGMRKMFKIQYN